MEELLKRLLSELADMKRTMATKQDFDETRREMLQVIDETKHEMLQVIDETKHEMLQVIAETKREMLHDIAEVKELFLSYHSENIAADEKLLEGIRITNDRLDFQREKLIRAEEELYLLTRKQ